MPSKLNAESVHALAATSHFPQFGFCPYNGTKLLHTCSREVLATKGRVLDRQIVEPKRRFPLAEMDETQQRLSRLGGVGGTSNASPCPLSKNSVPTNSELVREDYISHLIPETYLVFDFDGASGLLYTYM